MWRGPLAVVVVFYIGWGLTASIVEAAKRGWVEVVVMLVLFAVSLGSAWLAWRRSLPVLVPVTAVLALFTCAYVPYTGLTALFVAMWLAPFRLPLWQVATFAVTVTGGFVGIALLQDIPGSAIGGLTAGLGWTVLLAAVVNQLAVTKRQGAELATARVLAERQRLAREIHDILAHALSAQVVHLEGTRMLLERDGDRAVALARVEQAGAMARAGLEETKRAVAALRGDAEQVADELATLAEQFRATTGNPCVVEISGDPSDLSAQARLAVVRTAQEALTNVHKHAPRASVTVRLRCTTGRCELAVTDTGGQAGPLSGAGNGYGLVGMRERAELLGGELTAGPSETGFRVLLTVPA